jgi:hypothetical protein
MPSSQQKLGACCTAHPPPKKTTHRLETHQVCSVDMRLVEKLCGQLKPRPCIISLNPFTIEEVLQVGRCFF